MAFDVDGARKAGYSDAEIADFLGSQRKFDVGQARQAGYSDGEILSHLLKGDAPAKPAAVRAGEAIREVPRQIGLTARYALEGLPAMADVLASPVKAITDTAYGLATGRPGFRSRTMSETGGALADTVGLPTPQGANERVVGDITRTGFGAAGGIGFAGRVADATQGVTQAAARTMAANPGQQLAAAAGAGGAGGSVREAGGGPWEQMVASLVGGVAAGAAVPFGAAKGQQWYDAAVRRFGPPPSPQAVDVQIQLALSRRGIDWSGLSDDVRTALRSEVSDALRTGGQVRPEVLLRLADFKTVGATPTRGTVTLDPVQITREKNLAKTGANSTDIGMQRLSRVENDNNRALIDALNRVGANTTQDAIGGGRTVIGSLEQSLAREKAGVDSLYGAARDSQGRSFPLDGTFMTNRAANLLDDRLVSAALPSDVRNVLNRIARGEMPVTVDVAEQLKTRIGSLQRASNDGTVRTALGLVRQAIDDTPILPLGQQSGPVGAARPVNPGGLPAVAGATNVGDDAVRAFTEARTANRAMMQRIESTPALRAVYEGIEPDKFVQRFITGQSDDASVGSLMRLRDAISGDQQAMAAVRGQIAAHLKSRALNGAADEVGNFSASNFDNALKAIGREKLALFFTPQEVTQLEAAARVARYTQVQPRGSAVNNSNSGALVAAGALDLLERLSSRLPIGRDTVQGYVRGVQQSNALQTSPALVTPPAPPLSLLGAVRTTPAPALTGLLLTAPMSRNDERRGLLTLP
jgi:hypothetical protein